MRIFVFLNNKLISLDTILPLIWELKTLHPEVKLEFYCFGVRTRDVIEENVVLCEVLNDMGSLKVFGGSRKLKVWRDVVALFTLMRLVIWGIRGCTFIHFKALNAWPLRILYVINPRRTILFQSSSIGQTDVERRIDMITNPMRWEKPRKRWRG